jgi:hypothetical protein
MLKLPKSSQVPKRVPNQLGFFAFLFEKKEDRDLIFHSGPYFMGERGMYLNKWTPDFSP